MNNDFCAYSAPNGATVRAMYEEGDYWMVARDVTYALGYKSLSNPITLNVPDSCKAVANVPTYKGKHTLITINEAGLKHLLNSCTQPGRAAFWHWFDTLLKPALRGDYSNGGLAPVAFSRRNERHEPVLVEPVETSVPEQVKPAVAVEPSAQEPLTVFSSPEFGSVRTLVRDGEPWFVAVDVCRAMDVGNSRMAVNRLDNDEKMTVSLTDSHSDEKTTVGLTDSHSGRRGGAQSITIVNEPGMYTLVLGSRKPEAKTFKRWITHEVIPAIRKTGKYQQADVPAVAEPAVARIPEIAPSSLEYVQAATELVKAKQRLADTLLPIYQAANYSPADLAAVMFSALGQDLNI